MSDVSNKLLTDVCVLLLDSRHKLEDHPLYYDVVARLTGVCNTRYVNSKIDANYDINAIRSEVVDG